jgi:hypothetical protein
MGEHVNPARLPLGLPGLAYEPETVLADGVVDGHVLVTNLGGAAIRRLGAAFRGKLQENRRDIVQRPTEIDRGRSRGQKSPVGAV